MNSEKNSKNDTSGTVLIISSMIIGGILAFVLHYKYGPFFVRDVVIGTFLTIGLGIILGECSSRLFWLEMRKSKGLLSPSAQGLLNFVYPKIILYVLSGYLIFRLGGFLFNLYGKTLLLGLIFFLLLVRRELKKIFSLLGELC